MAVGRTKKVRRRDPDRYRNGQSLKKTKVWRPDGIREITFVALQTGGTSMTSTIFSVDAMSTGAPTALVVEPSAPDAIWIALVLSGLGFRVTASDTFQGAGAQLTTPVALLATELRLGECRRTASGSSEASHCTRSSRPSSPPISTIRSFMTRPNGLERRLRAQERRGAPVPRGRAKDVVSPRPAEGEHDPSSIRATKNREPTTTSRRRRSSS